MKTLTLLLTLLTCSVNAQTSFNFYYGGNEALGAEILIDQALGFGFAGTTEKSKALGEFSTGVINAYDKRNFVSTTTQKWFTLYSVVQLGYIGNVQISADAGVAMYGRHANFLDPNRREYYHKKDKLLFRPMLGLNASYVITQGVGWQIGLDTFNGLNTGFIVYF